ncbi:MAG TPA: glycoside hydrolase family 88 protein [Parafilimonas sp.]|nr:glycoside hydrolase family 88 protein [Parafilimonas sp.]
MKNSLKLILPVWLIAAVACSKQEASIAGKSLDEIIDQNFQDADKQYKLLMKKLPNGWFPRTYQNGSLITTNADWWCSGFYPGSLLYIYEQTKNIAFYDEAIHMLSYLEKEQYNTTTHDLGFMMYSSFGNALRFDSNNEAYKKILINSAKSLAGRFNPKVGCIKSWDSRPSDFLVIIDNMMNLELLFWATRETGDSSYYKIAVTHANTTMKNHFRPDYSSCHVVNYDPATGAVIKKYTAQGYADNSAWARGQSWGFYGFTMMYRETKDIRYLEQAENIAHFILSNPNLPADKIPYWDYNAPDIPGALRDASAAAIMASAFVELSHYADAANAQEYKHAAETILFNLSTSRYKASIGTNGGFILKHGVGGFPQHAELDVPLTYTDYYFLEAMKRYKE